MGGEKGQRKYEESPEAVFIYSGDSGTPACQTTEGGLGNVVLHPRKR